MKLSDLKQKKGKRKTSSPCQSCFLHLDKCICEKFHKIENHTHVDLLVHYKELKRTSNSGRLIESLLENQRIWVRGELDKPLDHSSVLKPDHHTLMLFPSEDAQVLDNDWLAKYKSKRPFQLLVPDGNWRQAGKVHYRVEELKHIQRVTLPPNLADTDNLLRVESKENGMSTLEAIGYVLGILEGVEVRDHLLRAYRLKKEAVLKARGLL